MGMGITGMGKSEEGRHLPFASHVQPQPQWKRKEKKGSKEEKNAMKEGQRRATRSR